MVPVERSVVHGFYRVKKIMELFTNIAHPFLSLDVFVRSDVYFFLRSCEVKDGYCVNFEILTMFHFLEKGA